MTATLGQKKISVLIPVLELREELSVAHAEAVAELDKLEMEYEIHYLVSRESASVTDKILDRVGELFIPYINALAGHHCVGLPRRIFVGQPGVNIDPAQWLKPVPTTLQGRWKRSRKTVIQQQILCVHFQIDVAWPLMPIDSAAQANDCVAKSALRSFDRYSRWVANDDASQL